MTTPLDDRRPIEAGAARHDLLKRVVSGLVLGGLALGSAMLGGRTFALFWLVACTVMAWEWQRMVDMPGAFRRTLAGGAALAAATPYAIGWFPDAALAIVLAGVALTAAIAPRGRRLWCAVGIASAGALLVAVCLLRSSISAGLASIIWVFAVVWGTDVFAYFGGRFFRGPKLWPRISPSKTWSGFVVGVVAGASAGAAFGLWQGPMNTAIVPLGILGLCAASLSQAGDLFESAVKRHFGVKDSSRLIPGHGGVMDRLDGFLAAAVFAALVGAGRGSDFAHTATGLFAWWTP